ncbi:hypothetical protein [Nocardia macrotermitis]|uniref:hypothetical protein n=1 Tax=Nocardia macrotermitis TaxID=2585198 RepID=UPI0012953901|nr:hypothetical protein [Nocardia macrotermitis]
MSNPLRPQAVALLAELSTNGANSAVWSDLRDELYYRHIGEHACAALPALAALAGQGSPLTRMRAIELAADLLARADPHAGDARERYAADIAALLVLVRADLARKYPDEDHESDVFVYRMRSMLAFEGETEWSRRLAELLAGEFETKCPECSAVMYVAIGAHGVFTCWDDDSLADDVDETDLVPASPARLTGLAHRLHTLAVTARQPVLARRLTYLFGRTTCPRNAHEFTPAGL